VPSKEGKWQVRVERANGQPRRVLYSNASAYAAQHRMAEFLSIPAANIIVHYAESSTRNPRASHTTTPVTPPPRSSSKSKRPFDSFEPQASTSQATCRAWCKKPILKNTERIGIQRQFLQCTGWKPHYYHHRKCISDENDTRSSTSGRQQQTNASATKIPLWLQKRSLDTNENIRRRSKQVNEVSSIVGVKTCAQLFIVCA
jgi:hypothetical protein